MVYNIEYRSNFRRRSLRRKSRLAIPFIHYGDGDAGEDLSWPGPEEVSIVCRYFPLSPRRIKVREIALGTITRPEPLNVGATIVFTSRLQ